jgi:glucose/arabinose dehydrogenase
MQINRTIMITLWLALLLTGCNTKSNNSLVETTASVDTLNKTEDGTLPLSKIKLPAGFKIEIYADDVPNARSMNLSPAGTLFVGTMSKGNVYALRDENRDFKAEKKWTIASGLNSPNGVACKDGNLYVAEISRIWKFTDIEKNLDHPKKEIFVDNYPDKEHHGWKYIAFGPDGNLYVPVGAPCNICEPDEEIFGTITRLNMTTKKRDIVERGIRNTVGFTWHPQTKEMWFTDNGGDWLGEDMPSCELNYAPKEGMNFGFPYCHQGDYPDPKLGKKHDCSEFTPPAQKLGAHVAPLGLEFYTGTMFPETYRNRIFIAEHGSWNRTVPSGYRVVMVKLEGNKVVSSETFAEGWLDNGVAWGRPVDIELLPDGSMLVSDDAAGVIYRISYQGEKKG